MNLALVVGPLESVLTDFGAPWSTSSILTSRGVSSTRLPLQPSDLIEDSFRCPPYLLVVANSPQHGLRYLAGWRKLKAMNLHVTLIERNSFLSGVVLLLIVSIRHDFIDGRGNCRCDVLLLIASIPVDIGSPCSVTVSADILAVKAQIPEYRLVISSKLGDDRVEASHSWGLDVLAPDLCGTGSSVRRQSSCSSGSEPSSAHTAGRCRAKYEAEVLTAVVNLRSPGSITSAFHGS